MPGRVKGFGCRPCTEMTWLRARRPEALIFVPTVDPKLRSTDTTDLETGASCDIVLKPQYRPVEHGVAIASHSTWKPPVTSSQRSP
jgi:hypothetical protein